MLWKCACDGRQPASRAQRSADSRERGQPLRIVQGASKRSRRVALVGQQRPRAHKDLVVVHLRRADLLAGQAPQALIEMHQREWRRLPRVRRQRARQCNAPARGFRLDCVQPIGRAVRQAKPAHHALVDQREQAGVGYGRCRERRSAFIRAGHCRVQLRSGGRGKRLAPARRGPPRDGGFLGRTGHGFMLPFAVPLVGDPLLPVTGTSAILPRPHLLASPLAGPTRVFRT